MAQPGRQPCQLLPRRHGQEQLPRRQRRDLLQHPLQYLGLHRQHHHVAALQHLPVGRAQPQAAALRLRLFGMGVVAAEGHAPQLRRRDAPHHGGRHAAKTDKSDDHMRSLLSAA